MASPDEERNSPHQTPEIAALEKIPRMSITRYFGVVLHNAFEDFGLGKDMAIGTVISLATLGLQVWKHLIPIADWQDHKLWWILSFALPYFIILAGHVIWRVTTAPWRLLQRQETDHGRDMSEKHQLVSTLHAEIAEKANRLKN